jgi:hypothetical protein
MYITVHEGWVRVWNGSGHRPQALRLCMTEFEWLGLQCTTKFRHISTRGLSTKHLLSAIIIIIIIIIIRVIWSSLTFAMTEQTRIQKSFKLQDKEQDHYQ